jgi:hypothetical protein
MRDGGHLASKTVFTSATPSDWRSYENTFAEMRRALPPEPKPERPVEPRVRRKPSVVPRPEPVRDFGTPLILHRMPEPERREYPPEPRPRRRLPGGPAGFRSCLNRAAVAARRRADRLAHAAETLRDREPCRDISAERDRLRRVAAHADQRATVAEALATSGRDRRR